MRLCPALLNASRRPRLISHCPSGFRRCLLTLAIETSCDDTAVAVLESRSPSNGPASAIIHFQKKITSNNAEYHGVHPLASLYSHQENLSGLIDEAILHLPPRQSKAGQSLPSDVRSKRLPDFIAVTRGPGMRSNLFTGIDTAKGLAAAWQIDLVGVHHMQAHALTPRLVAALQNFGKSNISPHGTASDSPRPSTVDVEPAFPFLSVLASGGHTLLIQSASLTDHKVLGSTGDIAVGECLDKIARVVLPMPLLEAAKSTMYGALLEKFAFSDTPEMESVKGETAPKIAAQGQHEYFLEDNTAKEYQAKYATRYAYVVPKNKEVALRQNTTKWGWYFSEPLTKASGGIKNKSMEMSFSGLMTAAERVARFQLDETSGKRSKVERSPEQFSIDERRDVAREAMRAAFEHVASRVVLGLQHISTEYPGFANVPAVVMSGGVAANAYLRYILASTLVAHGYSGVRIIFPPPSLCTDNAAMIAWTGIEMYQAGYKDPRTFRAIRKWPLDQLLSPPKDI